MNCLADPRGVQPDCKCIWKWIHEFDPFRGPDRYVVHELCELCAGVGGELLLGEVYKLGGYTEPLFRAICSTWYYNKYVIGKPLSDARFNVCIADAALTGFWPTGGPLVGEIGEKDLDGKCASIASYLRSKGWIATFVDVPQDGSGRVLKFLDIDYERSTVTP